MVSHIQEDGYLRLSRVGHSPFSAPWDQSHEGQPVVVVTVQGLVPGAEMASSRSICDPSRAGRPTAPLPLTRRMSMSVQKRCRRCVSWGSDSSIP